MLPSLHFDPETVTMVLTELARAHGGDAVDAASAAQHSLDCNGLDLVAARLVRDALQVGKTHEQVLRFLLQHTQCVHDGSVGLADRFAHAAMVGIVESVLSDSRFDLANDDERTELLQLTVGLGPDDSCAATSNVWAIADSAIWARTSLRPLEQKCARTGTVVDSARALEQATHAVADAARQMVLNFAQAGERKDGDLRDAYALVGALRTFAGGGHAA